MPSSLQVDQIQSSDGNTTYLNSGTLSNLTFPAGHVIFTDAVNHVITSGITVSTTANDYLGSDLEVSITPKANGNKLYISCFIPDVSNSGSVDRALHAGFRYDANFSSGDGTILGPRQFVADHHGFKADSGTLLTNLQYSLVCTVGTNAPSAGSTVKIRPYFQAYTGNVILAQNAGSGFGVFSLIIMEIQQ